MISELQNLKLKRSFSNAVLFCLLLIPIAGKSYAKTKIDSLKATDIKSVGRVYLNENEELELISSAAHFGFKFRGTECRIFTKLNGNEHNYLQYELDGVYQKRIRVDKGDANPVVLNVSGKGEHTINIYKATEAHTGAIIISKIEAEHIKIIKPKKLPYIEFIGNSITCGAAADFSEVPCGTGQYHDQHNAYLAYGPRVARELSANYVLSSVSGIGIYRNWNSNGPTMPQVYENLNFQEGDKLHWNFKTFTPKIVSIALGTNDFSNGDGTRQRLPFDSVLFVSTYVKFVQSVKAKYPKAKIALLSSAMVGGSSGKLLERCLSSVKKEIDILYPSHKPISLFFFEPMSPKGCSSHPSTDDHAVLAKQLIPFYKNLLGDN